MTQPKTIGEIMEEVKSNILTDHEVCPTKSKFYGEIDCRVIDDYTVFFYDGREFYDRSIDEFRDIDSANRILEDMREKSWVDDSVIRWMLDIVRYKYGYRTTYPCGYLGFCHEAPKFAL